MYTEPATTASSPAVGIIALAVILVAYLLPLIVGALRQHPQIGPIAIVNILMGWTLVGWVVALAWAVSSIEREHTGGHAVPHV
jgi:hypothetical protein